MASFDLKPKVKFLILDKPVQWGQWKAQLDILQQIEVATKPDDNFETQRETFTQEDLGAASKSIYHTISRRLQQEFFYIMKEPYTFFKALKPKFKVNTQGGIGRLKKELWAKTQKNNKTLEVFIGDINLKKMEFEKREAPPPEIDLKTVLKEGLNERLNAARAHLKTVDTYIMSYEELCEYLGKFEMEEIQTSTTNTESRGGERALLAKTERQCFNCNKPGNLLAIADPNIADPAQTRISAITLTARNIVNHMKTDTPTIVEKILTNDITVIELMSLIIPQRLFDTEVFTLLTMFRLSAERTPLPQG
ncbi:hypothetical protein SARC_08173 [Sphaeroforma arctica JP610]|uniref:Uncharacterized protein n=1 Tax=Sphaeroforma arctica JP610 TaxID=667725 RepID=A0A0L0FS64_9EUKA|nr:hypothetical protein SARC_08173 [Sphaeroforma arctica JP610]KNC79431.1 hypothetical protein SARC_08173 [Sphaeroforma arctica JP610]|eukprot:XP_014153333.1 hypothetical protein SARC_08173 [Sphaeroforma arctica JP610]